jgi:5-deoxy-glucuronate isomerase
MTHHRPAGSLAGNGFSVDLGPSAAGWTYSGLRVLELSAGETRAIDMPADECLVVPLRGSCTVATAEGGEAGLAGRADVFSGVTDVAYVPVGVAFSVHSGQGGRFAIATARAGVRKPFQHVPLERVAVELRGAGPASRQVNNFGTPAVLDADRLIACEVLTPAGNWSSYPPHKHDEDRPGAESVLEEVYYFEVRGGAAGPGMAYQRVYGTPDRPVDVLAEVRDGDVVLIPHGWHGPSMAVPGYDLYYLNVMAGPGERAWLICDDPAHAWIRDTWAAQPVDPRLPMSTVEDRR